MVYGSGTGSICYDQGLDEHSSFTQKSLKRSRKTAFRAKIFFACGAPKKEGGLAALADRDPQSRRSAYRGDRRAPLTEGYFGLKPPALLGV